MDVKQAFQRLTGEWRGTNKLRVMPTDPYADSEATATITLAAHGKFVTVAYTWADQGEPQDGVLLLGGGADQREASAVWVDSWHQSDHWMTLTGTVDGAGTISVDGVYGGDWGWRITLAADGPDALRLTMDNKLPPDLAKERGGPAEYQVVEAVYTRG